MVQLLPETLLGKVGVILVFGGLAVVFRRGVPKAYALGFLAMLVVALDLLAGILGRPAPMAELGFVASEFLAGNAWWTPVTSLFAHAGLLHIVGNLFILVAAGPALEDRIGEVQFLALFFVAGLVALGAHTLLAYTTDVVSPTSVAVGASGAIFGILTAFAVRHPRELLPVLLGYFLVRMPAFVVLLVYLGFNLVYMLQSAGLAGPATSIAWWGHFAGFLVGLVWAYWLPKDVGSPARAGVRGLPDPSRLEPLATTPELRRILDRIRQFTPEARTADDAVWADAWLGRFFQKARCPTCGRAFRREGLAAVCESGETRVEFQRVAAKRTE